MGPKKLYVANHYLLAVAGYRRLSVNMCDCQGFMNLKILSFSLILDSSLE